MFPKIKFCVAIHPRQTSLTAFTSSESVYRLYRQQITDNTGKINVQSFITRIGEFHTNWPQYKQNEDKENAE
jgi:hypothetical protein